MKKLVFLAALLAIGSGCETITGQQRRVAETRLYSEVANMRADIARIEQRIAGLEAERELLHAQVADLQSGLRQADSRRGADLAAMDAQLKAQSQEQVRMRREITDELSGRMAKIMQTQAVSASKAARTQAGYEHEVKAGQTLSEIAREYKVSSAAIIKANNMKNPDDLRVGQKLFIPE